MGEKIPVKWQKTNSKKKGAFSKIFAAFLILENVKQYEKLHIPYRDLYTFYPLFEVHLCTVTFGLMYG